MRRGFAVDEEAIRKLARLLEETGLTEIEVAEKDSRLRVVRTMPATASAVAPLGAPSPALAEAALPRAATRAPDASDPGAVTSPMVGIAYLSPEPGATPFVRVGDKVAAGQTLVLIEAMKTFNPIKASRAGTVAQILIESGSPVEYGEVLLVLD